MDNKGGDDSERGRQIRQASVALTIPMMMAAGPLVGFGLGWAAGRYLGAPGWVTPICIAVGFAAGVRQTIRLIRQLEH
jgi:F0F1-type ATP synthase assembly protein I